jgi:hypothetical protein
VRKAFPAIKISSIFDAYANLDQRITKIGVAAKGNVKRKKFIQQKYFLASVAEELQW